MLEINNLTVKVLDKIILNNFNLNIKIGEIHTIMGLNGSGKSTICKVLMGDPNYEIVSGSIFYKGKDLLKLDTTERAKLGLFLVSQNPIEIPGVKNSEMLKIALENKLDKHISIFEFSRLMNEVCERIDLDKSFIHRNINEGMSGGEKKKNELMHMWVLEPNFIILDEIDSGVDIDNLNIISNSIKEYFNTREVSILIITHHTNILKILKPDYVHILSDGNIKITGDYSLAENIENNGYNSINLISESKNDE